MPFRFRLLLLAVLSSASASAQMEGMQMPQSNTLTGTIQAHTSSGTTVEPASTPTPMVMKPAGNWLLMLHGEAFLADIQQHAASGRGGAKLFSTNWIMPMAQRHFGRSELTLRTMLSAEPATISGRFYPELFQQGETAYGKPILDGQHPHDFVMELAALYDLQLNKALMLSLYAAPVGDPALGPTAYPHRQSASEDPIAALGHHQQDSTHIAFNVVTAGLTYKSVRLETSGFHGAEPTENRWQFQPSPNGVVPDSYSGRITWAPAKTVSAQYSIGHLTGPESLIPKDNETRQTASVSINRPVGVKVDTTSMPGMTMTSKPSGNWSTTLLWGQAKALPSNAIGNSYLLESLLSLHRNSYWTRMEWAARTSELLIPAPANETVLGHVAAFTFGYDRQYRLSPHLLAAPGAQATLYHPPAALAQSYGAVPFSFVAFVRLRVD